MSSSERDVPPAIVRPGDELPPNFDTKKIVVATPEQNTKVMKKLMKLLPPENGIAIQRDLERAKKRAPKPSFRANMPPQDTFFERPDVYIRTNDQLPDEVDFDDDLVEYELDSDDESFLSQYNKSVPGNLQIGVDDLEFIVDRLEKEAFLHAEQHAPVVVDDGERDLHEAAEASDCCVCQEGLSEDTNQIIFCDGCDIAIHQCCYGVNVIPDGEWYCDPCKQIGHGAANTELCVFCGQSGGAMRRLNKRWVHIQCAYYIPEVSFELPDCGGKIFYKEKLLPWRKKLTCYVCHQTGLGAPVTCSVANCRSAFHVTCGMQQRLRFRMEEKKKGEWYTFQFCEKHTPHDYREQRKTLLEKDEQLRQYALTHPPKSPSKKRSGEDSLKYCGGLTKQLAKDALHRRYLSKVVGSVYQYWAEKRSKRRGMALLKRFTPSILNTGIREVDAGTLRVSHRRRIPAEELTTSIPRLRIWRRQLEQMRFMMTMIQKREQMKMTAACNVRDRFDAAHFPSQRIYRMALARLREEDPEQFFEYPVNPEFAPLYSQIIRNPMDFTKIERDVDNYDYSSEDQFFEDVELIFKNAMFYNKPETPVYDLAEELLGLVEGWRSEPWRIDRSEPPGWVPYPSGVIQYAEPNAELESMELDGEEGATGQDGTSWYSGSFLAGLKSLFAPGNRQGEDDSQDHGDSSSRKRRRSQDFERELRPNELRPIKRAHVDGDFSSPQRSIFKSQDASTNLSRLKSLYEMQPPHPRVGDSSEVVFESEEFRNGDKMEPESTGRDLFEDISGNDSDLVVEEDRDEMELEMEDLSLRFNLRSIWEGTRKKDRQHTLKDIPVFQQFAQMRSSRATERAEAELEEKAMGPDF